MMADSSATPAQQVEEMIDYAGTTAAGLISMKDSPIQKNISDGLNAAVERARTIC
jgi:pyrroline-5-carboxylate reductase